MRPAGHERVDAPPPVRFWRIGDPGRSFTEVHPLIGDALDAPDTILDGGQVGPFSVYAASVRGLSHRQAGTPRQDAYGVGVSKDGRWLVVTVADGVSAGRHSHRAAQMVARHATRRVGRMMDGRDEVPSRTEWYELFEELSRLILGTGAQKLKLPLNEVAAVMATTATIVLCPTDAVDGQRRVQVAWLGDSPAWIIEPDRTWSCLTSVKGAGSEVSSSAVVALPQLPEDPAMLSVREELVPVQAVLLAMSDGVGDPLGDGTGQVAAALTQAWSGPPASALDFALQVGFGRKSFDDDRTVVGVWDPEGFLA
ncbi:protein phosphatase 2C domain-containing protein [Micromonospora sp. WMMD736]|uniref:protein phosphatase 2C domain-containing protein n=1 Tax=Micromonospora sp. WMMD736 TaxID=3404112 RepID=UPI003B95FADF